MFDGTEVDDAFADGHADPPPILLAHPEDPIREVGVGEVAPLGHRDPRHLRGELEDSLKYVAVSLVMDAEGDGGLAVG